MTQETSGNADHAPLPLDIAERLLDQLASDDEFRRTFQANPANALASLGYAPAQAQATASPGEGQPFYCMTSATLAPKDEIARARQELLAHLTNQLSHNVVYCFESGKLDATLRRK